VEVLGRPVDDDAIGVRQRFHGASMPDLGTFVALIAFLDRQP
jgi:hypothetical protein